MKKCYLLLFLVLLLQHSGQLLASNTGKVLHYYSSQKGSFFYRNPDIIRQAARFDLSLPGYLTSVSVLLGGSTSGGQATVHIYGHEGGVSAPVVGRELTTPITVYKTIAGPQKVTIEFSNKVLVENNQFFVVVDNLSAGTVLLSDYVEKQPICSSSDGGTFTFQALQRSDGRWFYGRYAYYIDAYIEYPTAYSPIFERDSLVLTSGQICRQNTVTNLNCADVNNDGYLDLLVGTTLLVNDGTGKFIGRELADDSGARNISLFIDADSDGWDDILVIDVTGDSLLTRHRLLMNENGRFRERTLSLPPISHPTTFSVADINADGFADLFIGQYTAGSTGGTNSYLLINNKGLFFTDRSDMIGSATGGVGACISASFVDINKDSYPDLYIAGVDTDELWVNYNGARFVRTGTDVWPGHASGCFWADLDNNGWMDVLLARQSPANTASGSQLYLNEKQGSDINLRRAAALQLPAFEERHSGGAVADINNDGRQDYILLTSCQCRYADMYIQEANGNFELKTSEYGLEGLAGNQDALWADLNNDGRQELVLIDRGQLIIYRNKCTAGNTYVQLDLRSDDQQSVAGAQVDVYTDQGSYTRQVISGRGLLVQDPARLHFGLGNSEKIDSVLVHWPDGQTRKFTDVDINSTHRLHRSSGQGLSMEELDLSVTAHPNPFSNEVQINYSLVRPADVSIIIYDAAGRVIQELFSGRQEAGTHSVSWGRRDRHGLRVAPGLYLCEYSIDGHRVIHTLTVID